jgi:hypothetical protein
MRQGLSQSSGRLDRRQAQQRTVTTKPSTHPAGIGGTWPRRAVVERQTGEEISMSTGTSRINELEQQGFWVVRLDRMKPLIGNGKGCLPFPDSTEPLHWIDWLTDHGFSGVVDKPDPDALPDESDPGLVLVTGSTPGIVRVVSFRLVEVDSRG